MHARGKGVDWILVVRWQHTGGMGQPREDWGVMGKGTDPSVPQYS